MSGIFLLIGGISGYLIVLSFVATVIYVKLLLKNFDPKKYDTISDYGKDNKIKPYITFACILISLLNIPFMLGLYSSFVSSSNHLPLIFGSLASLFLILTGLSVNHPDKKYHHYFAYSFMALLVADGFFISLSVLKASPIIGILGIGIAVVDSLISLLLLFKLRTEGIAEITFLTLNSIWIILFSTMMVLMR
jgi:hypothetical protein